MPMPDYQCITERGSESAVVQYLPMVWPSSLGLDLPRVAILYLNRTNLLGSIPMQFRWYLLTLSSEKHKVFGPFSSALRSDHKFSAGVSMFILRFVGRIPWFSRCHNLLKYHQYLMSFVQIIAGRKSFVTSLLHRVSLLAIALACTMLFMVVKGVSTIPFLS